MSLYHFSHCGGGHPSTWISLRRYLNEFAEMSQHFSPALIIFVTQETKHLRHRLLMLKKGQHSLLVFFVPPADSLTTIHPR